MSQQQIPTDRHVTYQSQFRTRAKPVLPRRRRGSTGLARHPNVVDPARMTAEQRRWAQALMDDAGGATKRGGRAG